MSTSWKNALVSKNQTIREALIIINEHPLKMVIVSDSKNILLGTLTDGDVRRSLLKGSVIDDPISVAMNKKCFFLEDTNSAEQINEFMQIKNISTIPILDSHGKIKSIKTLEYKEVKKKHNNPVFIMAGGFGKRLKPLTNNCPKPMLKLGDKPILEHIIQNFIDSGFEDFYISTHYMPEVIMDYFDNGNKWGVSIQYVHEENALGTGGALSLLPNEISKEPLILINGDVVTSVNFELLLKYHYEHKDDATVCVRDFEYQVPFGVIEGNGSLIKNMTEKPSKKFLVNAGVYVLNHSVVESPLHNKYIDMPTLLQNSMSNGSSVHMFPIHEYWSDIGRHDDLKKAKLKFK
jgi:dTDP-glucose pyrophosphorylase/CBS domain-containing protein